MFVNKLDLNQETRFTISCMTTDNFCFYLQNRLIQTRQTSQTGGQWYSDTSPPLVFPDYVREWQ